MENLGPRFRFDYDALEKKIGEISKELKGRNFDRDGLREKILRDYEIEKLKASRSKNEVRFLAVDSSTAKIELRYDALWGVHVVVLSAVFDSREHRDPIADGRIFYRDLMYDSHIDLGIFKPYSRIDDRLEFIRIQKEFSLINSCDIEADIFLIDGSLYTIMRKFNLREMRGIKEYDDSLRAYNSLLRKRTVGMVEDSHSTDFSRRFGIELTNLSLFDLILEENEYVVENRDGIWICYIKLPSKKLSYKLKRSRPLTVRWEFSYPEFRRDLENLVYIWSLEDDILHPQIYPLRIADYLTRRIRISGILERLVRENDLELRYRERREC